jgi:Outer membrane protein
MKSIYLSIAFMLLGTYLLSAQENKVTELSLRECVQMAVDRNINIQTARIDREKSAYKVSETRAALLPKINVNGSFTDYLEKPVTLLPGEIVGRPGTSIPAEMGAQYNTTASATINQVLYNQTALTALNLSKKMETLSSLSIEKAREELASEVCKLYFLSLTTAMQKTLVEENIVRTKHLSDIIKSLVDNGMGTQVDYERISVSLENLYTHSSNTEAALEQQLNLIRYILVIPIEEPILLTDTAEMPLLMQIPQITADFTNHIDIRVLESQKEINQLNQK